MPYVRPGRGGGQCGYERKATALPGLGHISKAGRQSVAIRVVGTPRRGPFIRKSHRPLKEESSKLPPSAMPFRNFDERTKRPITDDRAG